MYNVYITGDRSLSPMSSAVVVNNVLANLMAAATANGVEDMHIITSTSSGGIEAAVRYLVPKEHLTVVKRNMGADGHLDFDATNDLIQMSAHQVIVLHPDPMSSRVTQSVARIFDPKIVMYPITTAMAQELTVDNL